ncbi:MAG: flagellar hook protein FlgE [Pseudomonadota bacterium]
MSFQTALTGLSAAQGNLGVTGNNISNSSTTGFKRSRAEFADVYAANVYGSSSTAIGGGVKLSSVAQQFSQGNIDFTDNPLDLAISGEGFFRLDDNGSTLFSRAGMFKVDKDGFLVNSTGQSLTGYQASPTGDITGQLDKLQVDTSNQAPSATGELTLNGGISAALNLDSNEPAIPLVDAGGAPIPANQFNRNNPDSYTSTTSMTSYDTLGNALQTTMYFARRPTDTATGNSVWDVHTWVTATDSAGNRTEVEVPPAGGGAGDAATIEFTPSGALDSVNPPAGANLTAIDYDAPNNHIVYDDAGVAVPGETLNDITGGEFADFDINMAGTTQYGSPFAVNALTQDGYSTGQLSGVDVDESGVLFARYTNGQTRALGQVALASFANPQGLKPDGDTMWAESFDSGQPLVGAPGTSTLGLLQSGALESSNVDISKQLVNMIIAQRDFQANAKMISTEDQVTQSIINIR